MHESFDVAEAAELDIRLATGEITVDASLEGRVEVELIAHDDESQRLVDEARIELREGRSRPQIVVDVPQRRGGFTFGIVFGRSGITCRVRCPEGSFVAARTKSADLAVHGTTGGLTLATASGDLVAERVAGDASVKSASGDVQIREVTGSTSVQTASGDIEIGVVRGPVTIATASGDVTTGEAYGDLSSNTVSGDQRHGAVLRGRVAAHSVSGDVTIGVRRGSKVFLDCNTVSGDTSSELEPTGDLPAGDGPLVELRAKTVSGDIRITRAPAPSEHMQEVRA